MHLVPAENGKNIKLVAHFLDDLIDRYLRLENENL